MRGAYNLALLAGLTAGAPLAGPRPARAFAVHCQGPPGPGGWLATAGGAAGRGVGARPERGRGPVGPALGAGADAAFGPRPGGDEPVHRPGAGVGPAAPGLRGAPVRAHPGPALAGEPGDRALAAGAGGFGGGRHLAQPAMGPGPAWGAGHAGQRPGEPAGGAALRPGPGPGPRPVPGFRGGLAPVVAGPRPPGRHRGGPRAAAGGRQPEV